MENGSLQYENQILKSELEAEHFILTQMAELGKVRNVQECQVAINNLEKSDILRKLTEHI